MSTADLFRRAADNTLVPGTLLHSHWFANSVLVMPNAGATSDGYIDAVQLVSTIQGGSLTTYFMTPAGCTSVRFSFSGSEASQKPLLLKVQTLALSDVAVYRPGLASTATPVSWTVTGLTASTTYVLVVIPNEVGTAGVPIIGPVTLTPLNVASGLFSQPFVRISIDESVLGPTANNSTVNAGQYTVHESLAECSVDMPQGGPVVVESFGTNQTPTGIGLLVNGRAFQGGQTGSLGQIFHDSFSAPSGLVTARAGATKSFNNVAWGNWLRAIYVPKNADARSIDAPAGKTLVILGDSIACGYLATIPCLQGWTSAIRSRWPGNVLIDAYGGRTAFDDMQDAAHRSALALRLQRVKPVAIVIPLGTNDYGGTSGAVWTAANFQTGIDAGLVALNAAMPGVPIYWVTPIARTPNTANSFGAGNALSDYTAAINAACAAHPTYATAINGQGSRFPTTGDLNADGVHPTTAGHAKYAEAMIEQLVSLGLL